MGRSDNMGTLRLDWARANYVQVKSFLNLWVLFGLLKGLMLCTLIFREALKLKASFEGCRIHTERFLKVTRTNLDHQKKSCQLN